MRRLSFLLLLVPLAGVAAARAWPVEAAGVAVGRSDVVAEVLGVGTLESDREVAVSFEVAGRVTSLAVDEGAPVRAGDLLGTVDVSDAGRELAVAEASVEAAHAAVARAAAELDRAQAGRARASADLDRARALAAAGALPLAELDAAVERARAADAEVEALRAGLAQAGRAHEVADRTRAVRVAQVRDGELRSPLDGLVVARRVEAGQLVGPGTPAFSVASTAALRVRAWVDEAALGRLQPGQPARITLRSEPGRAFAGRLEVIGREVDRSTHELLVEVAALELPASFALGQRADVWIEVGRREAVTAVPRGWCEDGCAVVEDGRVALRPVSLGLEGRERVEVRAGLGPDDVVLAPGAPVGRRVRVRP